MTDHNDLNLMLFDVVYLTRKVNLNPFEKPSPKHTRGDSVEQGLICYQVYAKNAEDAIVRLREQEPVAHPIVEVARVNPAPGLADGSPRTLDTLILPLGMTKGTKESH